MKKKILHFLSPLLKLLAKIYTAKERQYSYNGINVIVKAGIFHPGLFFSTKILMNFVDTLNLKNKTFLELGAGTGIISILAAKKGAEVTASDINKIAVDNIKMNVKFNSVKINIIHSNLFEKIPKQEFDFICINPPYYAKDPNSENDYAWYCGKNFEYFKLLFDGVSDFINSTSFFFMILSDECEIKKIFGIAKNYGFSFEESYNEIKWGERNTIYTIKKLS